MAMHRRSFVRLLAAATYARTSLARTSAAAATGAPAEAVQKTQDLPALRVVSSYTPAATPGMPGPYPGRVVAVNSARSVDTTTGKADEAVVREMMAQGMRALAGAGTTADAWRRFFEPSDVVGIKVNCGGYPHCISAYEI